MNSFLMKIFTLLALPFDLILEGIAMPSWHARAQTQIGHAVASNIIIQHLLHSYEAIRLYGLIFTRL